MTQTEKLPDTIIRHIKDDDGIPFATVAVHRDGSFGWSICNRDYGDRFVRKIGREIASGRLKSGKQTLPRYPLIKREDQSRALAVVIELGSTLRLFQDVDE
tara:strand:+ start:15991 stop:16293 length:303 start_codon:yes stop_codon:yes gene_type:complete